MNAYRQVRESAKLTRAEFARSLGLTTPRIWQVEDGRGSLRIPRILALLRIYSAHCVALGLTVADFVQRAPVDPRSVRAETAEARG